MSSMLPQAPLRAAVISTFEELAFLFLEPLSDLLPVPGRVASVAFRGAVSGRLELCVSGGLLPVLAANMLGIAQAPLPPLQDDALRELANVVCGNLMPAFAGREAVVHLDSPVLDGGTVRCGAPPAAADTADGALAERVGTELVARNAFRCDEGCVVVTLVVAAPPA